MAIIICLVVCVIDGFALLFYLRWANARRERNPAADAVPSSEEKPSVNSQAYMLDTTDLKNSEFRYVY